MTRLPSPPRNRVESTLTEIVLSGEDQLKYHRSVRLHACVLVTTVAALRVKLAFTAELRRW